MTTPTPSSSPRSSRYPGDRRHAYPVKAGRDMLLAGVPVDLRQRFQTEVHLRGYPSMRWVILRLMERFSAGEVEP